MSNSTPLNSNVYTVDREGRFCPQYLAYLENAVGAEKGSDGNMVLTNVDAKYLIINQDEKIHHSNDVQKL